MCSQYASDLVADVELLVEDDAIVTMAILNDVFDFLRKSVVCSRNFYEEEYFVRQVHLLITNFIVNMPLKVKELRTLGDEAARILQACAQEGLAPPVDQRQDFETFMRL
ncbi:nuclear pore complex Nup205, partial [Paramuricea clavata]